MCRVPLLAQRSSLLALEPSLWERGGKICRQTYFLMLLYCKISKKIKRRYYLICTRSVIVKDSRRCPSFIDTTDDFLCADVRREAFVGGLFGYFFQCGECELGPMNANAPPYRMVGIYFENIEVLVHGNPLV